MGTELPNPFWEVDSPGVDHTRRPAAEDTDREPEPHTPPFDVADEGEDSYDPAEAYAEAAFAARQAEKPAGEPAAEPLTTPPFGMSVVIPPAPQSRSYVDRSYADWLDEQPDRAETRVHPPRRDAGEMPTYNPRDYDDGRPGWGRRVVAVLVWFGILALMGAVVLTVIKVGNRRGAPSAHASTAPASSAAAATTTRYPMFPDTTATPAAPPAAGSATEGCADNTSGTVTTGTGAGGHDSGPAAILWFEHSYYVERSAARAWQVVAPTARLYPPATMQRRGIDTVPLGTRYCVRITAGATPNTWAVTVTEQRPGQTAGNWDQTITTREQDDGTTQITAIHANS